MTMGKELRQQHQSLSQPAVLRTYLPFTPSGSLTAWLKGIVLGIILLTGKRCISRSRIARLWYFGQRIQSQLFQDFLTNKHFKQ